MREGSLSYEMRNGLRNSSEVLYVSLAFWNELKVSVEILKGSQRFCRGFAEVRCSSLSFAKVP